MTTEVLEDLEGFHEKKTEPLLIVSGRGVRKKGLDK